jgi:hypothetical protein
MIAVHERADGGDHPGGGSRPVVGDGQASRDQRTDDLHLGASGSAAFRRTTGGGLHGHAGRRNTCTGASKQTGLRAHPERSRTVDRAGGRGERHTTIARSKPLSKSGASEAPQRRAVLRRAANGPSAQPGGKKSGAGLPRSRRRGSGLRRASRRFSRYRCAAARA